MLEAVFASVISNLNFLMCIVIVVMAFFVYNVKKSSLMLHLGIAYSLFCVSHLALLLENPDTLDVFDFLIQVRLVAYLVLGAGLYLKITRSAPADEGIEAGMPR